MVTHDEQAAATTNRIIRLRDGRITGVEAVRRPTGGHAAPASAAAPAAAPGVRRAAGPSPASGPAPASGSVPGPTTTCPTPRTEAR